ncbi:VOC family protein [Streptosporangium subroseum]|uniref:VOC family protein n=1 Tax=Streptosporangium subroseum TaxID=106412 RepID=UPI0034452C03
MIGRWHGIIIDCPNPSALAAFYQEPLGMQQVQDDKDRVVIGDAADRPGIAFQRAPDFRPPRWPDPDQPQQMHIDVRVADLFARRRQCGPVIAGRLLPVSEGQEGAR